MNHQLRHGDVFLTRIAAIPADAELVERDNGRVVLAYGEVTGHAHVLERPASRLLRSPTAGDFLEVEGDLAGPLGGVIVDENETSVTVASEAYGRIKFARSDIDVVGGVVIPKTAWSPLSHEEHTTEAIPAGMYQRMPQREYSPEAIRDVLD